jgi:3-phenylpropionate/trans-cinnamate dioxygenase alpha subunit
VWHPRGPDKTEIWSYCVVDKDAPEEVKEAMRLHLTQTFGPAGNLEQDDMNNWVQCTSTARGLIARRYPQNIQAHLGHEDQIGPIGGGRRLRAFYARWEMMMKAENWSQVDLKTKYF